MKSISIPAMILAAAGSLTALMGQAPQPPQPAQPPAAPRARTVSNVFTSGPSSSSYVGVYLAEIDGARAKALKLREERGVEVTKVEEDSPASRAGLKTGDVVLDYNGQPVEGIEQFRRFVRETPANREVKMQVSRDGNVQNFTVKVGQRKGMEPMAAMVAPRMPEMPEIRLERPGVALWSRPALLGVEADSIGGQLGAYFGVKEGVLVRSVVKGSSAEKAGIRAGDVIVKSDDTKIATAVELAKAVRAARTASKKSFPVVVMRDRKENTVTVTVEEDDRSEVPGFGEPNPRPAGFTIRL